MLGLQEDALSNYILSKGSFPNFESYLSHLGGAGAPPFGGIPAEAVCVPRGVREESGAEGCILSVDNFCNPSKLGNSVDYQPAVASWWHEQTQ